MDFMSDSHNGNEIYISSDKRRLKQILINLISNSLKFTLKGYITVEVFLDNDRVEFVCKDSGRGITEKDKKNLFKMFGKGQDTANLNKQGSGLGLSFCKSMIQKMGGQIALTSTFKKGAEVRFYIIPEAIELKELYVESIDALEVTDRNQMNTIR